MHIRKKIWGYLAIGFFCMLSLSWYALANDYEDIDPKFIPFMLKESDMPDYKLKQFGNKLHQKISWPISDSLRKTVIGQIWQNLDENEKEIKYNICIYDSEIQAHNGVFYYLNSFVRPNYCWGSFSGSIIGDKSWTNGIGLAFIKGNIGGHVIPRFESMNMQELNEVLDKIFEKIENNIHPEILEKEEKLRKNQLSESEYNTLLTDITEIKLKRFSPLKQSDSKWPGGTDEFVLKRKIFDPKNPYGPLRMGGIAIRSILPPARCMTLGRRSEWQNEQGMVIGIDICEFTSEEIAENAAKRRTYESDAYFLDNPLNPQIPTTRWWYTFAPASIVYVINKTAVHIYQFNKRNYAEVDLDFFANSAKKIAERIGME